MKLSPAQEKALRTWCVVGTIVCSSAKKESEVGPKRTRDALCKRGLIMRWPTRVRYVKQRYRLTALGVEELQGRGFKKEE